MFSTDRHQQLLTDEGFAPIGCGARSLDLNQGDHLWNIMLACILSQMASQIMFCGFYGLTWSLIWSLWWYSICSTTVQLQRADHIKIWPPGSLLPTISNFTLHTESVLKNTNKMNQQKPTWHFKLKSSCLIFVQTRRQSCLLGGVRLWVPGVEY